MTSHRRRILVLAYYHGLGHVVRSTAIAAELHRRGHDVLLACAEAALPIPRDAGIPCTAMTELDPIPVPPAHPPAAAPGLPPRPRLAHPAYLQRCLEEEATLIERFRPDLVIFDFRVTGGVSAALKQVTSLAIFNVQFFRHPLAEIARPIFESLRALEVPPAALQKFFGDLVAVPDYAAFDPLSAIPLDMREPLISSVQEIRYVGPLLRQYPDALPAREVLKEQFGSAGQPLVFVTMGGTSLGFSALTSVLSGLRAFSGRLVIATGPNIPPDVVEAAVEERGLRAHANVEVFSYAANALAYLKAADLAIIHGGHTTLMEGLLCGTPLIVAATQPEQARNGARVERLGVGYVLSPERSLEDQVAALVPRCLADATLRTQAEQVSRALTVKGTEALATYLETEVFPVWPGEGL
ncbi:MAG: glycosyltransferase [Firmicutes bacterium]|nr:glycosyltransferase [Bacillota bacterium]